MSLTGSVVSAPEHVQCEDLYLDGLRAHASRVLSLIDRERFSPTFGCMDRTFWAWKFVDFPGARFQEGLCYLSFLYAHSFQGNTCYKNRKLLEWIAGGIDFWAGIQRASGDFDEAYPYERSLAATSFSAFYLSEAFRFLGEDLPAATADRFRAALARAGDWLIRNDETHGFLSNHLAAAAGALCHAHQITGEVRFETRCRYFLDKILDHQSEEGWYEEYGGADPGYQTHGSFYLARIQELTGDERLLDSLERSFRFLAHFVHPDGSIGGEYTSRNTQTYYPAAFEMMAGRSAAAAWIAGAMRASVSTLAAAGLGTVDVYNLFPLLNNTVFAYLGSRNSNAAPGFGEGPSAESGNVHFPEAGLLKVRRRSYDLYVGIHKGGVFKMFDRDRGTLVASHSGYVGRLANGKPFSNQWNDPERPVTASDDGVRVEGSFFQTSRPVMDPYRFLAFRGFSLTAGRFKKAAYWLKALLVKVLIYRKRELGLRFVRSFVFRDDGIEVTDSLQGAGSMVERLEPMENFTTIHMGSSRYFVPHELDEAPSGDFWLPVDPNELDAGVERSVEIRVGSEAS